MIRRLNKGSCPPQLIDVADTDLSWRRRRRGLKLMLVATLLLSSLAATSAYGESSASESFLTRSHLTGDWGGGRTTLADQGATLDLRYTSSYQGLASGTADGTFDYGGKVDAFINLDSTKMGLWQGGGFRTHFEYSHGDANPNLGGAIFAVNTSQYWPVDTPDEVVATSLYYTQKVGERSSFLVGKVNPVDLLAADPFFGGWGTDRFMNLIFAAPPSGLVPVVFMGAVASIKTEPVAWSLWVFDPDDRTNDYLPGDLFKNGVNVSLTGSHANKIAGRKTSYSVTCNYSTAEGTDYSYIRPGMETTTRKGSYNLAFQFTHNLQESTERTDASWGFYLKAAIADGNPNYVKASIIAGIGGRALFFGRPQDSFGLGAFYYDLSDVLQDSLDPAANFNDESAVEAFYSYAVTPWLQIGADVQYIDPATGGNKNALVSALRTQLRF